MAAILSSKHPYCLIWNKYLECNKAYQSYAPYLCHSSLILGNNCQFISLQADIDINMFIYRRKLTVCPILEGEDQLRLLNYQHNMISKIQHLSSLKRLIFLDLYDNQIEEISGLSSLKSLRVLMLGKNRYWKILKLLTDKVSLLICWSLICVMIEATCIWHFFSYLKVPTWNLFYVESMLIRK